MRELLSKLSSKDLNRLKIIIIDELKSRNPHRGRKIYQKTIEMLEDLHEYPPREVADMYLVSRQYAYYLCKKHSITPVRHRKLERRN